MKVASAFLVSVLVASTALARERANEAGADLNRLAGGFEKDALLAVPWVKQELQSLLGDKRETLYANLDVSGPIDLIGGYLSIAGNAPHQGDLAESVVCIDAGRHAVEAGIYSYGRISVYARTKVYAHLSTCVRAWIAWTMHNDRYASQPDSVQIFAPDDTKRGKKQ